MATKANLIIDQGTDYSTTITLKDAANNVIDLTDYTGEAKLKKYYTSANSTSFSVSLGGNTGIVTLALTHQQTNALKAGKYVYDVELNDGSNTISRVLEGTVTITPSVTK